MNQQPQNKLLGAPALHPEPHPARFVEPARPVLPRVVPTLTVYADGLVNLNGDATRVLKAGERELMLLPPAPSRPRWALVPAIDGLGLDVNLIGWADASRHLRFRAPALAVALFAAVPPEITAVRLLLEPSGRGWQLIAQ